MNNQFNQEPGLKRALNHQALKISFAMTLKHYKFSATSPFGP